MMREFRELRIQANMDVTLEQVCRELPNGGCHQTAEFLRGLPARCRRHRSDMSHMATYRRDVRLWPPAAPRAGSSVPACNAARLSTMA